MRDVTYAKGVAAASVAAGPLFVISYFVSSSWWGAGHFIDKVPLFITALVFSLPAGIIFSILPHVLATSLLAGLGRNNVGVRLWPFWALAGAGLGWMIDRVMLTSSAGDSGSMFTVTGVACALICRWGTRWSD